MNQFKRIFVIFLVLTFVGYYFFVPDWFDNYESLKVAFPRFYKIINFYHNYIFYFQEIIILVVILINLFTGKFERILSKRSNCLVKRGISLNSIKNSLFLNVFEERNKVAKLFLRFLSLIYLIVFCSTLWQVDILNSNGIISYQTFFNVIKDGGLDSFLKYPSIFWLSQSNLFIYSVLFILIIISIVNFFRTRLIFQFFLWIGWLSVVSFGRGLFHFPWDTYLLEIGFTTIFLVYFLRKNYIPRILLIIFLTIFFRQWFSMAMTKIVWSSPYWYDFTFLKYFWVNQPSPTPIGTSLYVLPMVIQKSLAAFTLLLEMIIPLMIVMKDRGRIIAFYLSLFLSITIQITGNFAYFNILTIVISLWCLKDKNLPFIKGTATFEQIVNNDKFIIPKDARYYIFILPLLVIVLAYNTLYLGLQFSEKTVHHPLNFTNYFLIPEQNDNSLELLKPFKKVNNLVATFGLVAPHGVFKMIPNKRYALKFEGGNEYRRYDIHFAKGKSVDAFSYISPNINRVAYYLYYQSFGLDLEELLLINKQLEVRLPTTMSSIISDIKGGKSKVFIPNGEFQEVRIKRYLYVPHKKEYQFIDSATFDGSMNYKPFTLDHKTFIK